MRRTVLVIADDSATRDMLRDFLNERNFNVACVRGCQSATGGTRAVRPDVILIDLLLLGQCGIECATRLREHSFATTPMIAMSCSAAMLRVAALYDVFQAYVPTPLNLDDLLLRLGELTPLKTDM